MAAPLEETNVTYAELAELETEFEEVETEISKFLTLFSPCLGYFLRFRPCAFARDHPKLILPKSGSRSR